MSTNPEQPRDASRAYSLMGESFHSQIGRIWENIGIKIDIGESFLRLAESLGQLGEAFRYGFAIFWCERPGVRANVIRAFCRLFRRSYYDEQHRLADIGRRMRRQALLNAVLEENEAKHDNS